MSLVSTGRIYIDFNADNRRVENITFKVSPKKYAYKPYKPPKRKHNLILTDVE